MMSVAIPGPKATVFEQRLVLRGVGYDAYETIDDALGEGQAVRLCYVDGRLTFLTASRLHEWYSERLAELIKAVAACLRIRWEDAGSATYRLRAREVGVEGDKVFYLGANAERMRGPVNIDMATQPPPDLAVEVEVSHSADDALLVYARLGVPEVWRFDADDWTLTICLLDEGGIYRAYPVSRGLPALGAEDIIGQLRMAEPLGADRWSEQLAPWARGTIAPRAPGG